jgi:DNA replication protein DnaC
MTTATIAEIVARVTANLPPPPPNRHARPDPACKTCQDYGIVKDSQKRVIECPQACAAAQSRRARGVASAFKYHNWHTEKLASVDFTAFENMRGKELAVAASYMFCEGNPYTLAQAAAMFDVSLPHLNVSSNWLYLWGENGTGKTTLMAAAANRLLSAGKHPTMIRYEELYSAVKATYGNKLDDESVIVSAASTADYLLIDEISIPTPISPNSLSIMGRIIDYRNMKQLPTMFTGNWDEEEIERHWGRLIASRLMTAHIIKVEGDVLRPRHHSISSNLFG